LGIFIGLVFFGLVQVFWARWLTPPDTTDALCYHLPFVVSWLQNGNLTMPIMPAGDPSTPFFSLNASLWMTWLMLPFSSDILAHAAQLPFVILLMLACIRLVRQLRMPIMAALGIGITLGLLPDIVRGAFVAESDVMLTALLLAASTYVAETWLRPSSRSRVLAATALGLALGTKTLALPYVAFLSFAQLAAILRNRNQQGLRRIVTRILICALIMTLLGGYTYARNTIVMGNPIYPAELLVGNHTLLPGLYAITTQWKLNNPYYPFDWQALILNSRVELGWIVPAWILPGIVLAVLRIVRERYFPAVVLFLWIILTLCLFWFVLPYHFIRFLYSSICWGAILGAWGWYGMLKRLRQANGFLLFVIPFLAVNTLSIPKNAQAWQSPTYWVITFVCVGVGVMIVQQCARIPVKLPRYTVAAVPVTCALFLILTWPIYTRLYEHHREEQWQQYVGGAQVNVLDTNARISVAGTCVVYPFYGPFLQRKVITVRADGTTPRYNWGTAFIPEGTQDACGWLLALDHERIGYLYTTLDSSVGAWPVQDTWAARYSERFQLLWANDHAHLWRYQSAANNALIDP
jgi:hypothetical protein